MRVRTLRRRQLQHIILEVGERFALTEIFVIGSSAILAVLPDPPEGALTSTRDVDIIPPNDDDERIADRISYVIGDRTIFKRRAKASDSRPKPAKGRTAPKVQQQIELIQQLPRAKQRFVIEMLDTALQRTVR